MRKGVSAGVAGRVGGTRSRLDASRSPPGPACGRGRRRYGPGPGGGLPGDRDPPGPGRASSSRCRIRMIRTSEASTVTPRAPARRASLWACAQTSSLIASSGSVFTNSLRTFCPCAVPEFELYDRAPAGLAGSEGCRHPIPHGRIAIRLEHVDPARGVDEDHGSSELRRRARRSSSTVISSSQLPACRTNSAMRMRRLKSLIALTTASRFVRALVNRMASLSSCSGISIVVLMRQNYAMVG